jgi:phenylacetaldehyde dehydrogenase
MTNASPPAPSAAAAAFLARPHLNFINGGFAEAHGETVIKVENPSRAIMVARVQAAGPEDITRAVAAARGAFETGWGAMLPKDRARILFRFADLLEARAALIGEIETIEAGVPIALSVPTIAGFCADLVRYYAGWATKIEGSSIPAAANGREDQALLVYTLREPVGVVAAIVPWNAPVGMVILKMAPSLATGCTMVLKSAELAPLAAEMVAALWAEAGGPPGSFNLLHGAGRDVGAALVRAPGIDKVTFTGSTAVGKEIARAATEDLRRVTLELGGKSPFIVFPDAPMEDAIPAAALACFFLSGQNCMAGTRLFLHASVHDEFIEGMRNFTGVLRVGDALAPDTVIGPVISASQRAKILGFVSEAEAAGGHIAYRGQIPPGPGHYVAPTLVTGVTRDMRIAREEIFGPVLGVQVFGDDEDELAAMVGATQYGLSGSLWTSDLRRAHRFARRIDSGQVGVNIHAAVSPETPFGGNRQSGWGREFGREGLDAYLKTKAVSVSLGKRG